MFSMRKIMLLVSLIFVIGISLGFSFNVNAETSSRNCTGKLVCVKEGDFLLYKIKTVATTLNDDIPDIGSILYKFGKQTKDKIDLDIILKERNTNKTLSVIGARMIPKNGWIEVRNGAMPDLIYEIPFMQHDVNPITKKSSLMNFTDTAGDYKIRNLWRDAIQLMANDTGIFNKEVVIDNETKIVLYSTNSAFGIPGLEYTLIDDNIFKISNIQDDSTGVKPSKSELDKTVKKSSVTQLPPKCLGTGLCITAKISKVVDGDTIYLDTGNKIRLSLTNTPGKNQKGWKEATDFTKNLCKVGSMVKIDQDDKQKTDKYGRTVAKVTCSGKNLNSELLSNDLATISKQYCKKSEFSSEGWAKKYGC